MNELNHFVGVYCSNAHQMSENMTCGVFPMHAMTNHCCDPNCEFTSIEESDHNQYIRAFAKRDVLKGEGEPTH